jgi:hypothetical protein
LTGRQDSGILASRLGYIDKDESDKLLNAIDEITKMTMGLIKKLNTNDYQLNTNDWSGNESI